MVSANLGGIIGIGAALVGLIAPFYCGRWLAIRFCKTGIGRFLVGLSSILIIGVVNLVLVFAGCAANATNR